MTLPSLYFLGLLYFNSTQVHSWSLEFEALKCYRGYLSPNSTVYIIDIWEGLTITRGLFLLTISQGQIGTNASKTKSGEMVWSQEYQDVGWGCPREHRIVKYRI